MVSLVAAAALATACGAAQEDARDPAPATGPTEAELAFRERVLAEIESGEYTCHCTGALRARERIEKGLVKTNPP